MSRTLKNKIKLARKLEGLSQSQASKAWGIPLQTLQSWEAERFTPKGFTLTALTTMLEATIAKHKNAGEDPPATKSRSPRKPG